MRRILVKSLIAILLISIPNAGRSQNKFNDSLAILGYINTGVFASKKLSDKGLKIVDDAFLKINTPVFIISARSYLSNFKYYEVAYGGESYFVYKENVTLTSSPYDFYSLLKLDKTLVDSIRVNAIILSKLYFERKRQDAINFMVKCKKIGLLISKNSIYDESEFTNGTGFQCEVVNLSDKTIKYITFSIQGYNAVNDKVSTIKQLKGIGPITKNSSSEYTFEYVWFTDIVRSYKIVLIKLQFTDGSIKNITNTDLIDDKIGYFEFYQNADVLK
jgi:hypothetical protein